jgi:stress-induced morphogen
VQVTSDKFRGLSTLKQNRLVTQILKDEISAMHAIRIFTSVPAAAEPADTAKAAASSSTSPSS